MVRNRRGGQTVVLDHDHRPRCAIGNFGANREVAAGRAPSITGSNTLKFRAGLAVDRFIQRRKLPRRSECR